MNDSEWGLKIQHEIYESIHMVEYRQHLWKMVTISANGEKSKLNWYGPLNGLKYIFLHICFIVHSSSVTAYPLQGRREAEANPS